MAADPGGRPAGAFAPSIGDVPELVFAESCEEDESGLCPLTSLDFGTVTTGSSGPHSEVWLLNQSDSATATGLSFQSDPEFPVFSPTNSCLLVIPPELPPGGSCRLAVKFAPTTPGSATGTLTVTSAEGAETSLTLTGTGDSSEVVLYGQFHDWETMPGSFGLTNAVYAEDPEFTSELADDLLVEDPDGWTVSRVGLEVFSINPLLEILAIDVEFMSDDGGLPGDIAVCSAPDSQVVFWDPNDDRRIEIALSTPCVLPPGHYWLRARPTVSSFFNDNTFWGLQYLQGTEEEPPGEPPVHLNPPVFRNSGGGTGVCPEWTHIYPPDCGLEDFFPFLLGYDAVFWLIGQVGEVSAPELMFDPANLDFGDVDVGASETLSALLQNTGNAPATGLIFSGLPEAFTADAGACGSSLDGGESCAVAVTFTPLATGLANAELQVDSTELVSASLDLTGNGVPTGNGFTPIALEVDPEPFLADGNGVLEPGELVEVAPSWHSDEIAATPLAGTASEFGGGDGGVYFLALDNAEYGMVEPGATASCRDMGACYFVAVGPNDRPAAHWEATFDETLSDGTAHTWSLHIGDSFADVPRSSPFYTAVETLHHHGVTGGCGEAQYCPADTNTRGQMAVFLLRAAEDEDYVPPACTEDGERFADVPFDHPLCPWIEELAERGVTAGCGGGNYCPGDPVSRAQMAVFLLKAFEGDGYTPQECTGTFSDVDCPSTFAAWIEDLAGRGVTGGCANDPPAYCPATPVTRAQMAAFVAKTFDLALYGP